MVCIPSHAGEGEMPPRGLPRIHHTTKTKSSHPAGMPLSCACSCSLDSIDDVSPGSYLQRIRVHGGVILLARDWGGDQIPRFEMACCMTGAAHRPRDRCGYSINVKGQPGIHSMLPKARYWLTARYFKHRTVASTAHALFALGSPSAPILT